MATFVATSGPPPTAPTGAMSNHLMMSTSSYHRHHKSNFYSQGFLPTPSPSSTLSFNSNLISSSREQSPPKMASTIAAPSGSTVQRKISRGESIHSGHFMVSEIEETESESQAPPSLSGSSKKSPETESDYDGNTGDEVEGMAHHRVLSGGSGFHADFQPSSNENSQQSNSHFYTGGGSGGGGAGGGVVRFAVGGSVSVQFDSSLTKLFESMRLAYSGKITSPKWKAFKGLKLHIKDKIRLNNIIWRAWHIQYIAGRNPVVCQFSSSADSKRHKRTEAILLEGKYWKRRVDAVQEEYKKWRMYHRKGHGPQTPSRPSDFDWELSLPRWSNNLSNLDSLFSCEESGDFFSPNYINAQNSFGNYYDYNSREIARSGMGAQFMQPGLEQLQPNVDFMDTFEPIHETISRYHNNFTLPTVQEESAAFDANSKEQEDLFNSLFPQNSADASSASVIQQMGTSDELNKPMMETEENVSSYSTSSLFQSHNEMLNNMNTTLKQQQQQQSMDSSSNISSNMMQQSQINYNDVLGKLDLSSNNFTFQSNNNNSGQQQQMNIVGLSPGNHLFSGSSLLLESQVSSKQQQQQQSSMSLQQQQQFSSNNNNNSNLMSLGNSTTIRSADQQQQTLPTSFLPRYQVQAEQTQQPQGTPVNIFQPQPGMLTMGYGEQSSADKSPAGKGKYFTSSYYSGTSSSGSGGGGGGRSRSRSISMPHAKVQSSTIKSLLNKPSLVSTMGPGATENAGSTGGGASSSLITSSSIFRVPTASECLASSASPSTSANAQVLSSSHNHSGAMERSISLPVYSQERHRKLGIGGHGAAGNSGSMMLLQRLQQQQQQQQTLQNSNNSASLFEVSSGGAFFGGGNQQQQQQQQLSTTTVGASSTFFPAAMNSNSGSTSLLTSQQQQQYSNQETQHQQQQLLLPQQTNSSAQQQQQQQHQLPQIRKVSQSSVDYIGKLSDGLPQFGGSGPLLSFGGSNPNLMSNLMAVNSVTGQSGLSVFSPHHARNSSSSSSPIGSLQDAGGGKVNITFSGGNGTPLTFTLGGNTANQQSFLSSQHQQLQQQQQQQQQQQSPSPFGLLNKSASSRFKSSSLTDFKDHTQLELSSAGNGKATGSRSLAKKPANLFGSVDFSTSSGGGSKEKSSLLSDGSLLNQFLSTTAATVPSSNSSDPLTLSPRDTTFSFRSPFTSPPSSSSPGAGPLSPVSSSALLSLVSGSGKSEDRVMYKERRRVCHINAEQKRRCNIKNGFDTLRNLLPSLSSNTNTKVSKAAMLQKAAEYIRQLESEKYDQEKEYDALKQKVESLNQTISVFQNQLPATGAPVMGQRSSQIKEQYAEYVHSRTMVNWKFWVFSVIMESLLDSYCNTVATSNYEEMCKTLLRWLDQSCCLITLRRDVSNSLRFISTSTNILTNPEALPEEAILAVTTSKAAAGKGGNSSSKEVEDERVRKYSNR